MANGKWEAGDRAIAIPVDGGWVYMDQKAIDFYGEDILKRLNGGVETVITAE